MVSLTAALVRRTLSHGDHELLRRAQVECDDAATKHGEMPRPGHLVCGVLPHMLRRALGVVAGGRLGLHLCHEMQGKPAELLL